MEVKAEMKNLGLHAGDLHGYGVFGPDKAVEVAEEEIWFGEGGGGADGAAGEELLDDPSSLFYADEFPPLPDFPCMSSSSSSSSTHPPPQTAAKTVSPAPAASSSASTASSSWAVLRSDADDHDPNSNSSPSMDFLAPAQTAEADDVAVDVDLMENFGSCMDLLDTSDICWDPSPLFDEDRLLDPIQEDDNQDDHDREHHHQYVPQQQGSKEVMMTSSVDNGAAADDLAVVFFEWLKCNKEVISAEDLRNIKIKKSTIEAAARRLGGGKEGMKQLLKLILQWVQNHHLQSKKKEVSSSSSPAVSLTNTACAPPLVILDHDNTTNNITTTTSSDNNNNNPNNNNNNNNNNNISGGCPVAVPPAAWMVGPPVVPSQFVGDAAMGGFSPMVGYMPAGATQDPYAAAEYHHHHNQMMEAGGGGPPPQLAWGPAPPAMQFGVGAPHYGPYPTDPGHAGFGGYGSAPSPYPGGPPGGFYYHPGLGEGLVRLGASATKEARKKRMARQRRFLSHHHRAHHHHHHQGQGSNNNNNNQVHHHHQMNQTMEAHPHHPGVGNPSAGNWVYWPQMAPPPPPPTQMNPGQMQMQMQMQMHQPPLDRGVGPTPAGRQVIGGVDKKQQGWKTEKNLRFLLQKVLKQSDVGNLGRIVLPKKEAETHLPELEARDGIPIAMEDIGTSRVWNMRYRFWPNNKSRMYLLENTGDFVRSNGLQEGDFIVIYSDVKCGKYMIRGVKVRQQQQQQQQGAKPEPPSKKQCKSQQKTQGCSSPADNPSSSSPPKQQ